MWSDGVTLWMVENGEGADDGVYAYDLGSCERLEEYEFALAEANRAPRGIWSNGETAWVSDSGRDRVFAYDLASGEVAEEREFELAGGNRDARGIWSNGETMWVLEARTDALFTYDLATGELLAEYALASASGDPQGVWSDGVTVWVSDHGAKQLLAYRLPEAPDTPALEEAEAVSLERVGEEEFTHLSSASNNSPRGIWSDGDYMYVADESDDRVYTYNIPDAIDARLSSLSLSGVEFGEFDAGTTHYQGVAGGGAAQTTVEAEAMQRRTTVVIEPADADADVTGHQVTLSGTSAITVTVTSADGTRTRTYRVAFEAPSVELALRAGWTAIEWPGPDGAAIAAVLPEAVVAVYAWDEARGTWLVHFPDFEDVPGLNTLPTLTTGVTYWVAADEAVTWMVSTSGGSASAEAVAAGGR